MRKLLFGVVAFSAIALVAWLLMRRGDPSFAGTSDMSGPEEDAAAVQAGGADLEPKGAVRHLLEEEPGSSTSDARSTIVILEVGTGDPVSGVECRFQSASRKDELMRETGDDGSVSVPAAIWRIEILDPAWEIAKGVIPLPDEATRVAWATRRREILIRTVSPFGVAIPNVEVVASTLPESPMSTFDASWLRKWTRLGNTNAKGELLAHPPIGVGLVLRVQAKEYVPISTACSDPRVKQVRLVLVEDTTRLVAITVQDAMTGAPLEATRVIGPSGPIPIARRQGVRFFVRSSSLGQTWDRDVVVFVDGYCPSRLDRSALRKVGSIVVGLYKACKLSIGSLPVLKEATIGLRLVDLKSTRTGPMIPVAQLFNGKRLELVVPRDVRLEIHSVREDGRSDVVEILPTSSTESVTFKYEDSRSALVVTLVDKAGTAITRSRARLTLKNGVYARIVGDRFGKLHVPDPGRVEGLRIYARGYGTIRINPMDLRSSAEDRSGSLRLVLKEASPVRIMLRDESDVPVPAMRVEVLGEDSRSAMKLNPGLGGSRVTSHPAWSRKNQPNQQLQTDGAGVINTGLSYGRYRVRVAIPLIYKTASWRSSGYPIEDHEFTVDGETDVRLTVSRPVPVKIKVYSLLTRMPLGAIVVTSEQFGVGTRGVAQVSEAELWVPANIGRLRVGSPGFLGKEIAIPEQPKGPLDYDVYLDSTGLGTIEVIGLPKELQGKKILISAFKETPPVEYGYVGNVWQSRISFGTKSKQDIHIPHDGPLYMRLHQIRVDGTTYSFEPLNAFWRAAGHLQFRVHKEGR